MAAIQLVTKFQPYVDELFYAESQRDLVTNKDFDFDGAKTVKVFKVSTVAMNDYDRTGEHTTAGGSRYGTVGGIGNDVETFTLRKDRSFTFAVDKMDVDETAQTLAAAAALARQLREVTIPEIDAYVYGEMAKDAGTKAAADSLTAGNIFDKILAGNNALDNALAPDAHRALIVTPDVYYMMKRSKDIVMETETGAEMRLRGVISNLDGLQVIKVPAARLPEKFGFMIAHLIATAAPVKLADYKIHTDPPGLSGSLVEGRFYFDAFVLENKAKAIYYQPVK